MSDSPLDADHLFRLAGAVCNKSATEDDFAALDSILHASPIARDRYASYCRVHVALRMQLRAQRATQKVYEQINKHPVPLLLGNFDAVDIQPPIAVPSRGFGNYGPSIYFSSGWPVAYLVAAVIFSVGLFVGSVVYVSSPMQVANQSTHPSPSGREAGGWGSRSGNSSLPASSQFVGRITGMVDCQWHDPSTEAFNGANVPLGRSYALSSGLMEITYDTGAKVILQGPVTYEVESNGGYLTVGKLTGKLEKKPNSPRPSDGRGAGGEGGESSNSSFILHPSSFVIRTPTAIVTDLGTEFGVEVSKDGLTQVHVLQGAVDAQMVNPRNGVERHQRLTEGSAMEIGRKSDDFKTIACAPQVFTRTLRIATDAPTDDAYIEAVQTDKPLGYWPLNEPAKSVKFFDRSGNGFHAYAMKRVMPGQTGPFRGNSIATVFDGNGFLDVGRNDKFSLTRNFTIEAWVRVGDVSSNSKARIISANPGSDGRARRMIGWSLLLFSPSDLCLSLYGVTDHRITIPDRLQANNDWLHIATVHDSDGAVRIYVNGECVQTTPNAKPGNAGPVWLEIGGGQSRDGENWRGGLSHLAVYDRALDQQQITNHFNKAKTIMKNRD